MEKRMMMIIIMELLNLVLGAIPLEPHTPPIVTLTCTADYMSPRKSIVNATWVPSANRTAEDILGELQNCFATITCDDGVTQKENCGHVNPNSGWEWSFTHLSKTFCSVEVKVVLNDRDSTELSTTQNCTFQAPTAVYDLETSSDNPSLGDSYEIQCTASCTVEIINPNNVTVSWTGPNGAITNDSRLTITPTVFNGTSHTSTLQFSYLSEADDGEYSCNLVMSGTVLNGSEPIELNSTFPPPVINITALNDHIVGDPLSLECNVTTVRGVTSSVDIVWMKDDTVTRRINNASGTAMDNSIIFTDIYNMSTEGDGAVYNCYANSKVNASDEYVIDTSLRAKPLNSITAGTVLVISAILVVTMLLILVITAAVCVRRKMSHSSSRSSGQETPIKVPYGIDDTYNYLTLDRETASTCESVEDIKKWFDKSQLQTISEERVSLKSDDITDAEMLNYILNQRNEESIDSGNGTSLLNSSGQTEYAGGHCHMGKYLSEYSEEMSGYCSENNKSVSSDYTDKRTESSSNNSHSLPDYYSDEHFTGSDILPGYSHNNNHNGEANNGFNNEVIITVGSDCNVLLHHDLYEKDSKSFTPYSTSHYNDAKINHEPFQKDDFGYILESAI